MYAVLGNYPDCLEILLRNGSDATLGKDILLVLLVMLRLVDCL